MVNKHGHTKESEVRVRVQRHGHERKDSMEGAGAFSLSPLPTPAQLSTGGLNISRQRETEVSRHFSFLGCLREPLRGFLIDTFGRDEGLRSPETVGQSASANVCDSRDMCLPRILGLHHRACIQEVIYRV